MYRLTIEDQALLDSTKLLSGWKRHQEIDRIINKIWQTNKKLFPIIQSVALYTDMNAYILIEGQRMFNRLFSYQQYIAWLELIVDAHDAGILDKYKLKDQFADLFDRFLATDRVTSLQIPGETPRKHLDRVFKFICRETSLVKMLEKWMRQQECREYRQRDTRRVIHARCRHYYCFFDQETTSLSKVKEELVAAKSNTQTRASLESVTRPSTGFNIEQFRRLRMQMHYILYKMSRRESKTD